jgi:hypothetical protein
MLKTSEWAFSISTRRTRAGAAMDGLGELAALLLLADVAWWGAHDHPEGGVALHVLRHT